MRPTYLRKVARLTFQLVLVEFCFLKEKSLSRHLYLNAAVKASQLWVLRSCRRFFSTDSLVSKCGNIFHSPSEASFPVTFRSTERSTKLLPFLTFFRLSQIPRDEFGWFYDTVDTRRLWKWQNEWVNPQNYLCVMLETIGRENISQPFQLLRFDVKLDLA